MIKYKCIKSFCVPKCDDEGFQTGEEIIIEKDTVWKQTNDPYRLVGGEVKLEIHDDKRLDWLEISESTLGECFKVIK